MGLSLDQRKYGRIVSKMYIYNYCVDFPVEGREEDLEKETRRRPGFLRKLNERRWKEKESKK